MEITEQLVRRALALDDFDAAEAQSQMVPVPRGSRPPELAGDPREGAVLVLLYERTGRPHLVLTRRRDDLNAHAGQISFPGGRREPGEALQNTAVREAQEEVGIDPRALTALGELTCLYIPPTDYEVHPFVAWHHAPPIFRRQEAEVAEIVEVPLSHLLDPATRREEPWVLHGFEVMVPYFMVDGHKVWGATAMMLSEFLERLRRANQER
ncbi:MAG: CoA pyrophosphatase [Candidatus Promineifilaceae bacterium]|nr:CoA pyrophosphatase [Candidatus Promineifilaceae bacterium]